MNREQCIEAFENAEKINEILKNVGSLLNTLPVTISLGEAEDINMETKDITCPIDWVVTEEGAAQMLECYIEMSRDLWSIEHGEYMRNDKEAAMESKFFTQLYRFIYLDIEFENSAYCAVYEFGCNNSREAWKDYLAEKGKEKTKKLFAKVVNGGLIRDLPTKEALDEVK